MKLTPAEQAICDKYSARDADGYVHCLQCPLNLDRLLGAPACYAIVDGRVFRGLHLRRYE